MGITIHYKGKLKEDASVSHMIEEVKDISENYNWPYDVLDTDLPQTTFPETEPDGKLYGIVFSPPDCDPVWLTFLSNRMICSVMNLLPAMECADENEDMLYWCFTKTQFAGPEIHKTIVAILKYISAKYMEYIEVEDEADYWESGDAELLLANFRKNEALIDYVGDSVAFSEQKSNESIEEVILRILKEIQNGRNPF